MPSPKLRPPKECKCQGLGEMWAHSTKVVLYPDNLLSFIPHAWIYLSFGKDRSRQSNSTLFPLYLTIWKMKPVYLSNASTTSSQISCHYYFLPFGLTSRKLRHETQKWKSRSLSSTWTHAAMAACSSFSREN